jgi:hypothetical protein
VPSLCTGKAVSFQRGHEGSGTGIGAGAGCTTQGSTAECVQAGHVTWRLLGVGEECQPVGSAHSPHRTLCNVHPVLAAVQRCHNELGEAAAHLVRLALLLADLHDRARLRAALCAVHGHQAAGEAVGDGGLDQRVRAAVLRDSDRPADVGEAFVALRIYSAASAELTSHEQRRNSLCNREAHKHTSHSA